MYTPVIKKVARIGLVSKGVIYLMMGVIPAMAAMGLGGEMDDIWAIFDTMIDSTWGLIFIAVVNVALLGYIFWRIMELIYDPYRKGWAGRGGYFFSAISYLSVALYAFYLVYLGLAGRESEVQNNDDEYEAELTAWLYEFSWGEWLVGISGALTILYGLYQFYEAFHEHFRRETQVGLKKNQMKTLMIFGRLGTFMRGVVIVIIGYLFVNSAVRSAPDQIGGMEGAFEFMDFELGGLVMVVISLGFSLYGIFCFVKARYRVMGQDELEREEEKLKG